MLTFFDFVRSFSSVSGEQVAVWQKWEGRPDQSVKKVEEREEKRKKEEKWEIFVGARAKLHKIFSKNRIYIIIFTTQICALFAWN